MALIKAALSVERFESHRLAPDETDERVLLRYQWNAEVSECYYDVRSKVAHGTAVVRKEDLIAVHQLLKRGLIKMIENGSVPDRDFLERQLFGLK